MSCKSSLKESRPGDRKFSVSANRSEPRHRVRYVESGGAAVAEGECVFCDVTPDLSGGESAAETPVDGGKA